MAACSIHFWFTMDTVAALHLQSSSPSRVTAGAAGFFTLIQFALRPER
jgi:hypothetical protein